MKIGLVEYGGGVAPSGPQIEAVLRETDLLRHTAIFGASGAGKTNTVLYIVQQLVDKGIPVLFFDWKRTGRRLVNTLRPKIYTAGRDIAPLPFNPFLPPPGTESRVHAQHTVDLLAEAFTLGDGARSLTQRALKAELDNVSAATSEGMADRLIRRIHELADNPRARQWAMTAERVLGEMAFSGTSNTGPEEQAEFIKGLGHGATFIEMDTLSLPVRTFLATTLTSWLYRSRLNRSNRDKLNLVLVFEEAHHLLNQREATRPSQLETLLRLMREIGLGAVLIDQTPSRISGVALANTFTTICLNLKHPADVQRAASLLGLLPEERGVLLELPVGYSVVRLAERWNQPFMVRTPPVLLSNSSMSDLQVQRYCREFGSSGGGSPENPTVVPLVGRVPQGPKQDRESAEDKLRAVPTMQSVLNSRELDLMQDVIKHPDDGVKKRYKRLGLSVGSGHRTKTKLLRAGYLEQLMVPSGHSRKMVLGASHQSRDLLGLSTDQIRGVNKASFAHRYWQRWWAQHYESLGYKVYIEAPRYGGRVDVLVAQARQGMKTNERIGIEIETGHSDIARNVKNGLRSGFDLISVVATNKQALQSIEQALQLHGLLGLPQMRIYLRDKLI